MARLRRRTRGTRLPDANVPAFLKRSNPALKTAAQAMLLLVTDPKLTRHPNGQPAGTTAPMR